MAFPRCDGNTIYIEQQADLEALVAELERVDRLALDTEADSLHHYYEKVCLLQISYGGRHFLVDPLAGLDLGGLLDVLARRCLVLHGGDYDLRLLYRCYGFKASEVFDTMLAARFLGYPQLGLAALAERFCGVKLSKQGQKADWSKRPLSPRLIEYATHDTRHLICIADRLREELRERGRLEWHREACRNLAKTAAAGKLPNQHEDRWKVKGWATLPRGRALIVLRELWRWRENEAMRENLPPFRILRPDLLVGLARAVTENGLTAEQLSLPRNIVGARYERLRQAIARGLNAPLESRAISRPARRSKPGEGQNKLMARLREVRDGLAAQYELEPSLLCPNGVLQALAEQRPATLDDIRQLSELCDWQVQIVGERFLDVLRNGHLPQDS
jgi:ribonuclease D